MRGAGGRTGTHAALAALAACAFALVLPASSFAGGFPAAANGQIAFRSTEGPIDDIYLVNPDGSGLRNLTPSDDREVEDPSFSPDGRRIIFARELDLPYNQGIFTMDVSGGALAQLTNPTNALPQASPQYSPDGRQIVFAGDILAGDFVISRIFLMNADGSAARQISPEGGDDVYAGAPVLSPDGTKVAYQRDLNDWDIWVMDLATGADVNLTQGNPGDDTSPTWSPDGRRIAFSTDVDPGAGEDIEIALMPATGGPPTPITSTPPTESVTGPAFSPDGKLIAHERQIGAASDLWVMNADGSGARNLTPGTSARELEAEWQPIFTCGGRRATIVGDDGPDKIKGTNKADVIVANAGNDKIRGRGGNDRICGGRGKDTLGGGAGRDSLFGQSGKDVLSGNAGADRLRGGKGKDRERQ